MSRGESPDWVQPFRAIEEAIRRGADQNLEVVLCAPFVKASSLQWLLDKLPDQATVRLLTRWRPEEICAGVSDLEVWPLLRERLRSQLFLLWELHAKSYRFGDDVLVGSANLTGAGLGLSRYPNYEILVPPEDSGGVRGFERLLFSKAKPVDEEIYDRMVSSIAELEHDFAPPRQWEAKVMEGAHVGWLPRSRNPEHLVGMYLGESWELGDSLRDAAAEDLHALGVPKGFSRETFRKVVAAGLRERPFFREVFTYCQQPRRFGEVRTWLFESGWCQGTAPTATELWQTTIRWIAFFLPESLEYSTPGRYSEIVQLIP